jgi:hypothetical protein
MTIFSVSNLRRLQPGGSDPSIYIPDEQGGKVILPGTGFHLRRLVRFAGLCRFSEQESRLN